MKYIQTNITTFLLGMIFIVVVGIVFCMRMKENYINDDPMLYDLINTIRPIFQEESYYSGALQSLNNRNILKEIKLYKADKSYTINKQKVFLCLTDEKGEYYNKNMLIYVILHELAHVICDEIGHTEKFHRIFEDLLIKATEKGIYNPSIPIINDYCNHKK